MTGVTSSGMIMKVVEEVMAQGRGDVSVIIEIQDQINNLPIRQY
jgi:hypothetical protein